MDGSILDGPFSLSDDLAVVRHLPLGRSRAGTATLEFYEGRDILHPHEKVTQSCRVLRWPLGSPERPTQGARLRRLAL